MTPRRIAIVPHSHWDREWYESYQEFRLNLVDMLDTLLPLLESDASYPYFMLDGQMAVVDDYLEVRPEAEPRLRALAAAGRISMGPWYILMDEFLSSGETILRNLEMGIVRGAAFGGVMDVGYLPDMFGHIAQMPQILRQAGFAHAVVWRGVPSAITKDAFIWEAPDGSTVRAEYLPVGYGNGAALPDDAKALVRRTADLVKEIEPFLIDDLLCMNGSDHLFPQPWLGRVVAEANDLQDDLVFEVTSLPRYVAGAPTNGLEHWKGELRSGFRSNMLMGVTSNRVDVKRMGALAAAGPGASGRAPRRAVRDAGPVARPTARAGLEGDGPQLRARFDLRLFGRRCGRRGAPPLRRGADDRHRPGRPRRDIVRPLPGRAGNLRAQPRPAGPGGARRGRGRGGGATVGRRAGGVRANGPARFHGARRQHRAHGVGHAAGAQNRQ